MDKNTIQSLKEFIDITEICIKGLYLKMGSTSSRELKVLEDATQNLRTKLTENYKKIKE